MAERPYGFDRQSAERIAATVRRSEGTPLPNTRRPRQSRGGDDGVQMFEIKAGESPLIPGGDRVKVVMLQLDEDDVYQARTDEREQLYCKADFTTLIGIPGDQILAVMRNGWQMFQGGRPLVRGKLTGPLSPTGTSAVTVSEWDNEEEAWADSAYTLQNVRVGLPTTVDIASLKIVYVYSYSRQLVGVLSEC